MSCRRHAPLGKVGDYLLFKQKPLDEMSFSEFIRTASTEQKKQVYAEVLKKATARQNAQIRTHTKRSNKLQPST